MHADSEPHALFQGIALQRHIAQIRQKPALGAALGMAHIVAGEHGFAAELATTGHGRKSFYDKKRNWSPPSLCHTGVATSGARYTGMIIGGQASLPKPHN